MVKQKIRKAHNDYLKEILDEALDNPKKFWQYVKNRKQTASGVAPLAQHDKLVVDGRGKAEVLSKQYDSIFTEEDLTKVPKLGASPYPDMPEVESSRSPAHLYFMFNEPLNHNNQHPYLGVILSHNLRWKAHINDITAKASSTLGFVRRNLRGAMIEWNALPAHLVMAKSVEHFKAGVASHYGFPSCTQL
ncbi:hypothetical protein Bbelb_135180 [Branchiostoma belcheri]|nr:hypothetical protein Bbelb_135180 [Branchiostoma belcheri]